MDSINPKYQNGKIYTIRCRYDDNLIYVGSTIQPLSKRMGSHRTTSANRATSLSNTVNGNWDDWYIELYEEYPCNNKSILEKREGEIIRLIGTVNRIITGRTKEEYIKENKEKILENKKKYYENNKQHILEKNKKYSIEHKDEIKKRMSEYTKKYNENNKENIVCDNCKKMVSKKSLTRHKKSQKCQNYETSGKN